MTAARMCLYLTKYQAASQPNKVVYRNWNATCSNIVLWRKEQSADESLPGAGTFNWISLGAAAITACLSVESRLCTTEQVTVSEQHWHAMFAPIYSRRLFNKLRQYFWQCEPSKYRFAYQLKCLLHGQSFVADVLSVVVNVCNSKVQRCSQYSCRGTEALQELTQHIRTQAYQLANLLLID